MSGSKEVTPEFLASFTRAWNDHDVDRLMEHMADDCIFMASAGPELDGARFEGREAVRRGFATFLDTYPDAHFEPVGEDLIVGNRGVSQWIFTGTRKSDGVRVRSRGCDLYTFENGRIKVKDALRKQSG